MVTQSVTNWHEFIFISLGIVGYFEAFGEEYFQRARRKDDEEKLRLVSLFLIIFSICVAAFIILFLFFTIVFGIFDDGFRNGSFFHRHRSMLTMPLHLEKRCDCNSHPMNTILLWSFRQNRISGHLILMRVDRERRAIVSINMYSFVLLLVKYLRWKSIFSSTKKSYLNGSNFNRISFIFSNHLIQILFFQLDQNEFHSFSCSTIGKSLWYSFGFRRSLIVSF